MSIVEEICQQATHIPRSLYAEYDTSSDEQLQYVPLLNTINAVEGLICSGKTTFLEAVQKYMTSISLQSHVILETPSKPFLELFYSDMKKYAFSFQMDMLRQRQRCNETSLALAGRSDKYGVVSGKSSIVWNDRSMIGDPVFFMLHIVKGNIDPAEARVYLKTLEAMGPYRYDRVIFFDVESTEAWRRSEVRREKTGDPPIPLEYMKELRRAYYIQMRSLALNGKTRIVYIYNDPFVPLETALASIIKAPSAQQTRDIFAKAPELDFNASEDEISRAFAIIRAHYVENSDNGVKAPPRE